MTTPILSAAVCASVFTAPAGSRVFKATSKVSIEFTASLTICAICSCVVTSGWINHGPTRKIAHGDICIGCMKGPTSPLIAM